MSGEAKRPRAAIYVRVSTGDQSLRGQFHTLRELARFRGYDVVAVYRERRSAFKDRPRLRACMHDAAMRRWDVLLVWALDRFGRSLVEVVSKLETLTARGVTFVSAREAAIDTTSAAGRLIVNVLAAAAQFERERIQERTREGLSARRRAGVRLGRPPALGDLAVAALARRVAGGTALAAAAREAGVSPRTARRVLKAKHGTTDRAALARVLGTDPAATGNGTEVTAA